MTAPADLRVLCQKLSSTPTDDLLSLCPSLVNYVLRCGGSLSAVAADHPKQQLKDAAAAAANETPILVHRLKSHITTLLNGRTPASRFAGLALAKAVVDVGGWECLRTSEPWVRGLLSILQKPDPVSSKELCVVTLARIYVLLQQYPTLVREITTPTVPTFVTACLQLLKPPAPGKPAKVTAAFAETALGAISALVPLYPTTLRPFSGQIKASIRSYLAPTSSDSTTVPHSLRRCSRRLAVLLHHSAPKNSHAEDWSRFLDGLLRDSHSTADQVFRAVRESWEPSSSYSRPSVSSDGEPRGGGSRPEELPAWSGLPAGAQRLVGLLETISEALRTPTRTSIALPVTGLTDLASRILLVVPPSPGMQERDLREMLLNASISREEKDELWSVLPEIHVAVLRLLSVLVLRLGRNALPIAPELLDQTVRVLAPATAASTATTQLNPAPARHAAFTLIRELLVICGPTLPKIAVDSLGPVIQICCRDLLGAAGFLPDEKHRSDGLATKSGTNSNGGATSQVNADLYLPPTAVNKDSSSQATARRDPAQVLEPGHQAAAEALLGTLFSYLPQRHLKKAGRAMLDRTAILSRSKVAMVASVLHPYLDKGGRTFANTMPFLVREFPHDVDVEILRTNLRTKPHYFGNVLSGDARHGEADEDEVGVQDRNTFEDAHVSVVTTVTDKQHEHGSLPTSSSIDPPVTTMGGFARHLASSRMDVDSISSASGPTIAAIAAVDATETPTLFMPLTLKRKAVEQEQDEEVHVAMSPSKRQDKGKSAAVNEEEDGFKGRSIEVAADDGGGSDSDESVHLQMVLDDDSDDNSDDED